MAMVTATGMAMAMVTAMAMATATGTEMATAMGTATMIRLFQLRDDYFQLGVS